MNRRLFLIAGLLGSTASALPASAVQGLQMVYIGGWDCPACKFWKANTKAGWLASNDFKQVQWLEVETPRLKDAYQTGNWPDALKPILAQLPVKSGTPRFVIVKDGKVVSNSERWETTMADLKTQLP